MQDGTRNALLILGIALAAAALTALATFIASAKHIAFAWWVLAALVLGVGLAMVAKAWPGRKPRARRSLNRRRGPRPLVVDNIQNHTIDIRVANWRYGSTVRVTDPFGVDIPARLPEPSPDEWIGGTISFRFPNADFPPSQPPLLSGRYVVRLIEPRRLAPGERLVAKEMITIPDGLPGWFVRAESMRTPELGNFVTIYAQPTQGSLEVTKALCSIWEPGKTPDRDEPRAIEVSWHPGEVPLQAHFPTDFDGASLRHGIHNGTWMFWSRAAPVGGEGRWELIRRFWFRWPDWEWGETDPP